VIAALEHLVKVAAHYQLRENGFRYAPVDPFPYRIIFEIQGDVVVVYNIYHMRRRPIRRAKARK